MDFPSIGKSILHDFTLAGLSLLKNRFCAVSTDPNED